MDADPQAKSVSKSAPPDPERFWAEILSGDAVRIQAALDSLSEEDAASVEAHLRRMVAEEGWQPGQRRSARAALDQMETPGATQAG